MLDILILLLDEQYQEEIVRSFKGRDYIYHKAASTDEVVEICKQDFIDLILIWPATQDVIADLLTVLNIEDLKYIPVVPVVREKKEFQSVIQLPVAEVISIPLPREEFFAIINRLVQSLEPDIHTLSGPYWKGNLEEFSLIDLIHMVETSGKDAILTISYSSNLGQIYFRRGKLIRASLRNLDPVLALEKLAGLSRADFNIQFTRVDLDDHLKSSNQQLVVGLLEKITEQEKYVQMIPGNDDELLTLKYPSPSKRNEMKDRILEMCKEGQYLTDILILLNEKNLDILKQIRELLADGYLVSRREYEIISEQKSDKKGISRVFTSLSGLFRKEKKQFSTMELPVQKAVRREKENTELLYQNRSMGEDTVKKIQNFLRDV